MPGIVVKPRARILHGHDWVFSSEVLKVFGNPADGDVISLKDGKDHLIGSAIYNSKSQIVARRFSRRKQDLDLDFFKRRIGQAAEYRARRRVDAKLCRVVWSGSAEVLELRVGVLEGAAPAAPILVEINGTRVAAATASLQLEVDLLHGQKTG